MKTLKLNITCIFYNEISGKVENMSHRNLFHVDRQSAYIKSIFAIRAKIAVPEKVDNYYLLKL